MDAIAAVTHDQPYPYYAQLAARPGLHYDEQLRLWLAADPATVMEVMTHAACRVRPVAEPVPAAIAAGAAGFVFGELVRMNDGVRHAAPKMALQRALAALDHALVQRTAWETAVALAEHHPVHTAAGLADWQFAVPVQTVAHLLGFADTARVADWMSEFVACLSPLSSAAQLERAHGAAQALLDSLRMLVQTSVPRPGSLLALVLAEAEMAGWNKADAILANVAGLLSQTYEATAGLIGNAIVALVRGARHDGDLAALVRHVLRDDPPIHNTRRFVAEAAHIGGADVQPGQAILVLLAAAGKAAAVSAPEAQGAGAPLYAYGHGAHVCPGQGLSQSIACAALGALLARGPLPPLAWRYRPSVNARIPLFQEP
ncbi:cytochrome p450 oxidoreductase [Pseudoduganella ginsengisoli]|uniref:Cytochrome P450 n=1 Tax=Pseudoduganella ginsengisoli TaxID=1462440 RepID=A0A6L6PXQ4_9BURK|nr:cytochrome P450 [Pseudoduganella ginsengisoli]MTW01901.1 cytochrome P450 [Pseudoduganella ginsengisoli]